MQPGRTGSAGLEVSADDTATAVGSGDVAVLATPRVVALAEAATLDALRGALDSAETTVGVRVELDHLLPSPVGDRVRADATLTAVEGRRLTFAVEVVEVADPAGAAQPGRVVARGTVQRVRVDRGRFPG